MFSNSKLNNFSNFSFICSIYAFFSSIVCLHSAFTVSMLCLSLEISSSFYCLTFSTLFLTTVYTFCFSSTIFLKLLIWYWYSSSLSLNYLREVSISLLISRVCLSLIYMMICILECSAYSARYFHLLSSDCISISFDYQFVVLVYFSFMLIWNCSNLVLA